MEERRCLGCMRIKGPGEVCEHCGYREGTPNAPHQLAAGAVLTAAVVSVEGVVTRKNRG